MRSNAIRKKIRLLPTPKQEQLFWKSAGVARWAYNYFLEEQEKVYQAYLENGERYKNINQTKRVKQLEKKLKREQRKLSRKIESNIKAYKVVGKKRYPIWKRALRECKNIQKQKQKIRLLHRKLTRIRNNYLHTSQRR